MSEENLTFTYESISVSYDSAFLRQVTDWAKFRDNEGKLIEMGLTQFRVTPALVSLRRNNIDQYLSEHYPTLSDEGRTALLNHIEATNKSSCIAVEGDVSKATKGCC